MATSAINTATYVEGLSAARLEAARQQMEHLTDTSGWYLDPDIGGDLVANWDNVTTTANGTGNALYIHQDGAFQPVYEHVPYGATIAVAPEPEPRVVPITDFGEWLMKKYNKKD